MIDVASLDRGWAEERYAHGSHPVPRDGDVLASKRTARADIYTITVTPKPEYTLARRYSEAIDTVRALARQMQVDGWFTCDHTNFVRVAAHRRRRPADDGGHSAEPASSF
jgi:hypothetical protein